jgi:UDP-glucose 4-epimerase
MKRYVITGPTGAIGTALIERLAKEECEIYAVCRPDSKRKAQIPAGSKIHLIERDITDLKNLSEDIGHGDVFFHLAWQGPAGPQRNDMYLQNCNVRCALDAVEAAHQMGCECFIGAGSQMEYGRSDTPLCPDTPCRPETGYGMAKLCAGEMTRYICGKYGIRHVWPRILSVYGPRDGGSMVMTAIKKLLDGQKCEFTKGEQIWDFLYSADAADILFRLSQKGKDGHIYPVGSGDARQLREYIEEIRNIVSPGTEIDFGSVPYGNNQIMFLTADTSALKDDIGSMQLHSFEDGIKNTMTWEKKERKDNG